MMPGRFFLGVGTGENLNEHVFGARWPSASERREMLEEAVEVMRLLWNGELCSFEGKHYRVDDARIDAGFDHVYGHQIGPDQDGFFDFYERDVLPEAESLRSRVEQGARA